jgi:hypothetical protein
LIDFTSSSSQLLDGYLLQRFLFESSKFGDHISVWQLKCESQLWQIVVFGIGTRQGCELLTVIPPHLILVSQICVCIIIGSFDRVIDELREITSSSSLLLNGYLLQVVIFQSSNFGHHISVWQLYCESQLWQIDVFGIGMRQGCKLFRVVPPHLILVAWICVCIIIGSLDKVIGVLRQVD